MISWTPGVWGDHSQTSVVMCVREVQVKISSTKQCGTQTSTLQSSDEFIPLVCFVQISRQTDSGSAGSL